MLEAGEDFQGGYHRLRDKPCDPSSTLAKTTNKNRD